MRHVPVFVLVVLLVPLFGCGGSQKEEEEATAERPNILLVLTDDQPAATVAEMPELQAHLVDEGLSLTNAFVSHPRCCPSRATILDRKSTRLNSSHANISYAVFCLK